MEKQMYQVQIVLREADPKIWRRLLIPSDLLLPDFHKVIQTSMNWSNSHLHQFEKNGFLYAKRMPDDDFWEEMNCVEYDTMQVADLLTYENDKIMYEYDFGDGWEHDIMLEKIHPYDESIRLPVCLDGKRNSPPEDCGGIGGYENILEILKQPDHEEYEDFLDWIGEDFDPEYFDKDEVNELLQEQDYGCIDFFEE